MAKDSIPSFKPELERAYSRTVARVNEWRIRSQKVLLIFQSQIIVRMRILQNRGILFPTAYSIPTQCNALARLRVREEFLLPPLLPLLMLRSEVLWLLS
jgi:hypothetical protein